MASPTGRTLAQTMPIPPSELRGVERASLVAVGARIGATSVLPRMNLDAGRPSVVLGHGPRYVTMKTLGAGAMGEVSLVEDRDIGRKVAQKRLLPGAEASDVMRFVDEIRTVGRLDHPGIVPIHDVGLDERGEFFFVMKYVEGETLESVMDRLAANDPATVAAWDATRCIQVFVSLFRALDYAHERGVIHRDIKPANVMIGRYGEVVLMDWGVARPIGGADDLGPGPAGAPVSGSQRAANTGVGTLIGTPIYMSPEQAAGETSGLDGRSDLYSACVMFHELVTGRHLHDGVDDLTKLILRVMTCEAPSAMAISGPRVTPELMHFLHRGLQRDRTARWSSAGVMADELHAILDGRFRVQCPATLTKRAMRGLGRIVDRRPMTTVGGLLGVALAIVALVVLVVKAYLLR